MQTGQILAFTQSTLPVLIFSSLRVLMMPGPNV